LQCTFPAKSYFTVVLSTTVESTTVVSGVITTVVSTAVESTEVESPVVGSVAVPDGAQAESPIISNAIRNVNFFILKFYDIFCYEQINREKNQKQIVKLHHSFTVQNL